MVLRRKPVKISTFVPPIKNDTPMLHRGNITITGLEDINRHPTVSVRLENGNVWLTKHELARLFGVFIQTIDANMRSIFKSRILNENEATITEKQDKRYVTYYNLEAVIFLSFRINTYCTKLFREWVLNSLCEYKRLKEKQPEVLRLKEKQPEVLVVFNASDNQTFISYN